jgi:hypothetical protein
MVRSAVLLALLVDGASLLGPTLSPHLAAHDDRPTLSEAGAVGSWRVVVTDATGTSHPALVTFAADGTLTASEPPVLPAPPGAPFQQIQVSGGNGVWASTGDLAVQFTFDLTAADEAGTPLGAFTVRAAIELDATGEGAEGPYDVVLTDPTEHVTPIGRGTETFSRLTLESLASPSATATPAA